MNLHRTFAAEQANPAYVGTAEFANTNSFGGKKLHVEAPISAFANAN